MKYFVDACFYVASGGKIEVYRWEVQVDEIF